VIILTLYSTAIRRNELIGIRMTDLDLESRQILIRGKGNKDRIVYFGDKLYENLKAYLTAVKPVQYLFEGQSGGSYSATSVAKVVKAAAQHAGIDRLVTPHMLRHSLATHYITSGISVAHVQKLLGHSNIKTTMIYTHITDNDLRYLRNPIEDMDI
jgi:site-specific recombinase XerD